jgi:hypothetical protein
VVESALMSFRTTSILIAILAVLGAGVYFLEYRPNPDPSSLDPKLQIWKLERDAVDRVVARSGDQEQIMVKRPDTLWYLEPQDVRADYWRISGTLVRLSNMRGSKRLRDNNQDWATYGLNQPRAALSLTSPESGEVTLLIGEKSPTDGGYYAREVGSDTLWLVGSFNVEDIERFVKEPAFEPTPVATNTPTPAAASTPGAASTPAASGTPQPAGTPQPTQAAAPPGIPTVGVPQPSGS